MSDDVTLYCGDCLDILPTLGHVDAVVTDPPYGIGFKYNVHDDDGTLYESLMLAVVPKIQRLVGTGPVFMWQAMLTADKWHRWFPAGYRIFAACKGFVQWRPVSIQYSWDPVIFWGTSPGQPSVYRKDYHEQRLAPFGAYREKIEHPCPRPLEQVISVIELGNESRRPVLDPFMGSGTTGVACVRTGRRFIGIELTLVTLPSRSGASRRRKRNPALRAGSTARRRAGNHVSRRTSMKDGPPPGCVILLLFALVALFACGLLVSFVDRLAPQVAAGPVYQYAVCGRRPIRAYDGADGYVRAGRWVFVDPPLVPGRTPRCPTSARRGCCR